MGALLDILRGKTTSLDNVKQRQLMRPLSFTTGRGRSTSLLLDDRHTSYSASAIAYRCVHKTAANLASVDLTVLRREEPIDGHVIAELWNRTPNPAVSARAQKELVFARLELTGEQMLYLDRGETGEGEPTAIWPIWDSVDVLIDTRRRDREALSTTVLGYIVKHRSGQSIPLLPSEVLWLRYPHPFEPWGALAPWKAALYATESDAYAREWQRAEFQNGARPSFVVYLGDLDEQQHEQAVADFRANVEGAGNAGKSLLLSGPIPTGAERLTLTPAEMSYLESRTRNAEEVALAFGYRIDSILGGSTYENQRAAKTADWSDLYVPKLEVLASETDRQLLPSRDESCAFDLSEVEALRENQDAIYGRVQRIAFTDTLWIDEMRELLGYEPLPNGQGQQTLSEFRKRLDVSTAEAFAALDAGERVRPRARLLVTSRGFRRIERARERTVVDERAKLSVAKVLRTYDRHERIGQRAVRKLADRQERVVKRKLRDLMRNADEQWWQRYADAAETATLGSSPFTELPTASVRISSDDLLDQDYWREQTQELWDSWLTGVWETGGEHVASSLGISFSAFDQRVITAMQNRAQVLAELVTKQTRDVLEAQLLLAGVEGGESIEQLSKRISDVYGDLRGYRAERIARTETVGGYNAASHIGAVESGVVTSKTWLATNDDRTRESHVSINGETLSELSARYSNGCLHPGDAAAPPSETVNCRCVETYGVD